MRLYVKSFQKNVGTEKIVIEKPTPQLLGGRFGGAHTTFPTHDVKTITKYEYELPEEQEHLIEIAKEVALQFGLKVETIDVGQMDFFDESLPKEVKKLKNFPVLATESEAVLATGFSREDVERFLSHARVL